MEFNFPKILTTRGVYQQVNKIDDEVSEYRKTSNQKSEDEEAVDILHAVETFIRLQFEGREEELNSIIKEVIKKNTSRGYYSKECF